MGEEMSKQSMNWFILADELQNRAEELRKVTLEAAGYNDTLSVATASSAGIVLLALAASIKKAAFYEAPPASGNAGAGGGAGPRDVGSDFGLPR